MIAFQQRLTDTWPMREQYDKVTVAITHASNPKIIIHDSGGFEAGDEKKKKKVLAFIKAKKCEEELADQLHCIW